NREHALGGRPGFEAANPLTLFVELIGQTQNVAGSCEPHQRLCAVRIRADFPNHTFDEALEWRAVEWSTDDCENRHSADAGLAAVHTASTGRVHVLERRAVQCLCK